MVTTRIRRVTAMAVLGVVLAFVAGCGTTGTTTRFTLALDPATPVSGAASLHVAPATMDPDAPRLYAINVHEWGRFNTEDLANIEQSLVATLAATRSAQKGEAEPAIEVHLRVRRYLVGISNTGGAVLACVEWVAARPSGEILLQERFYATSSAAYVGTIGGSKDKAHRAIVRRIATTARYVAANPGAATAHPAEFAGTYTVLEEAIASVPEQLVSRGNAAVMAIPVPPVAVAGAVAVNGAGLPPWETARPPADFDWAGFLKN